MDYGGFLSVAVVVAGPILPKSETLFSERNDFPKGVLYQFPELGFRPRLGRNNSSSEMEVCSYANIGILQKGGNFPY